MVNVLYRGRVLLVALTTALAVLFVVAPADAKKQNGKLAKKTAVVHGSHAPKAKEAPKAEKPKTEKSEKKAEKPKKRAHDPKKLPKKVEKK